MIDKNTIYFLEFYPKLTNTLIELIDATYRYDAL